MLGQGWSAILTESEGDLAALVDAAQADKGLTQAGDVQGGR